MSQQLPPPEPGRIRRTPPAWRVLGKGTPLWRVHPTRGPFATAWNAFRHVGPLDARFDPHLERPEPRQFSPQARGILYAALEPEAAIIETFQATEVIDARPGSGRNLAGFRLARPLRLLDLAGDWPLRAGGNQSIHSGSRRRARAWARAIYEALPRVQGLVYPSSLNGRWTCVALFERAGRALPAHPGLSRGLGDPAIMPVMQKAATSSGFPLVEGEPV